MKKIIYFIIVATAFLTPVSSFAMPNPASGNCIDKGGVSEIRKDTAGAEYGMCVFKDGSECEEWSLYSNTCASGQNKKGYYEKKQSKIPNFRIVVSESGFKSEKNTSDYVEKKDAKYCYYKAAVTNTNGFSFLSKPVKMIAYSDQKQSFDITALAAGETSSFFDIYIPIQKVQKIDIVVNKDKKIKELDYADNVVVSCVNPIIDAKSTTQEIKDLQKRINYTLSLNKQNKIKVDGKWNSKTKNAIKKIQEENKVPVTGEVDKRTNELLNYNIDAGDVN